MMPSILDALSRLGGDFKKVALDAYLLGYRRGYEKALDSSQAVPTDDEIRAEADEKLDLSKGIWVSAPPYGE